VQWAISKENLKLNLRNNLEIHPKFPTVDICHCT